MSINHGANLFDLSQELGINKNNLLDFSSNINPFGSSSEAKKSIINNIDMVSIYPDPEYKKLKNSISNYCKCNKENILLGSGATELISSFITEVNPNKALLLSPSYSEYEKELQKINCEIIKYFAQEKNNFKIDVTDLIHTIKNNKIDLIIICNPNNPTGFAFTNKDIEKLLLNCDAFFMIDETYVEFTEINIFSSTNLTDKYSNLFVIRGTSKFFATPGIRLGYAITSNKDIIKKINNSLDLWNINIFATLMGEVMFEDSKYITDTIYKINKERDYLIKNLKKIQELKVYDSNGNFILCQIKSKSITAKELYNQLIKNYIVIRECSSFEGLNEYFFRICVLLPEHNKLLIEKLNYILN